MEPLNYKQWRSFSDAIERARLSMEAADQSPDDHIENLADARKVSRGPAGDDYRLTRDGAYAVVQNCDIRKDAVAKAHRYFRVRTMQAERNSIQGVEITDPALQQIMSMTAQMQTTRNELARQGRQIVEVVDGLLVVKGEVAGLKDGQRQLEAKVGALGAEHDWFTTLAYAKLNGLPTDTVSCQRHGARAGKLMRSRGQEPKKIQDGRYGTVGMYPIDVLDETAEKPQPQPECRPTSSW